MVFGPEADAMRRRREFSALKMKMPALAAPAQPRAPSERPRSGNTHESTPPPSYDSRRGTKTSSAVRDRDVWLCRAVCVFCAGVACAAWDAVVPWFYFEVFVPYLGRYALTEAWVASGSFFLWINLFSLLKTRLLRVSLARKNENSSSSWLIHGAKSCLAARGWEVEETPSASRGQVEAPRTDRIRNAVAAQQGDNGFDQPAPGHRGKKSRKIIGASNEQSQQSPFTWQQYFFKSEGAKKALLPVAVYMGCVHAYHQLVRTKPPPTTEYPEFHRCVVEVVSGILAYDFLMFFLHVCVLHGVSLRELFCRAGCFGGGLLGRGCLASVAVRLRFRGEAGVRGRSRGKTEAARTSVVIAPSSLSASANIDSEASSDNIIVRTTGARTTSLHARHHSASPSGLWPVDTVQHGFIDGFLQVFVNVLVQQWTPFFGRKHDFSRLLHNVVVTFLLTESHSGLDAPFSLHRVLTKRIYGGSWNHDLHHARGNCHFQQFFCYLDALFGFAD